VAEEQQSEAELPPLNKQTDLAWRQLRASILCARAFSQLLLDERGEVAVRDVLKLNERIFRFAQEDPCSKLASDRGIEAFNAVPDDEPLPESSGPSVCRRCRTVFAPYAKAKSGTTCTSKLAHFVEPRLLFRTPASIDQRTHRQLGRGLSLVLVRNRSSEGRL
jgi:hypothetical protein